MTVDSQIISAVKLLAAQCDGATTRDGQGFNKHDATFGKSLAGSSFWSPRMLAVAHRMLQKYQGQLAALGIDYLELRPPDETQRQTTRLIDSNGGQFTLWYPFSERMNGLVKTVCPGARWDKELRTWTAPLTAIVADGIRTLRDGYQFNLTPSATATLSTLAGHEEESRGLHAEIEVPGLVGELYPFQKAGVAYAVATKRTLIGDVMGLGKTPEALATLQALDAFPALVVTTATQKLHWLRETQRWLPGRTVGIVNGEVPNTDIVIINWDLLDPRCQLLGLRKVRDTMASRKVRYRYEKVDSPFKALVCDESHKCFTRDTLVFTDRGSIPIGDIVEQRLPMAVASFDVMGRSTVPEWKRIVNYYHNEVAGQQLVRVVHEQGEFTCTTDHHIWTDKGYIDAASLSNGTCLSVLPKSLSHAEERESDNQILFSQVCNPIQAVSVSRMDMPTVRSEFQKVPSEGRTTTQVLLPTLCSFAQSTRVQRTHEDQEPYAQPRNCREDAPIEEGPDVLESWRQRAINGTTEVVGGSISFADRIRDSHERCEGEVSFVAESLQSGFGNSREKDCHRSGWRQPPEQEVEVSRSTQDGSVERSRVVSVEVYEPEGADGYERGSRSSEVVYDIEVEGNHNFFANGVLVSNCKSSAALRSRAAEALAKGLGVVLCLTGTPVVNRPADLIQQLKILGRLHEFGGWSNFTRRFCAAKRTPFGLDISGASHLQELDRKLRISTMIRREKADVLKELPPLQRVVTSLDIDNRREYQRAEATIIRWLSEQAYNDRKFLESLHGLSAEEAESRRIAHANDKAVRAMRAEQLVKLNALKLLAARGKLAEVVSWIENFLEQEDKLIVFAWHREIQYALLERFPDAARLVADDSATVRRQQIDRFQGETDCHLIVCSLQAGSEGWTGTAASHLAFVELGWTPAIHDQSEGRVYARLNDAHGATAHYLLAADTIDEWISRLIEEKRSVIGTVTGSRPDQGGSILDGLVKRLVEKGG